jgi:putative ABC transport system substrate-binding protein
MIQRREFITLLGGAAATWPIVARAQQAAMPVIGILSATSSEENQDLMAAFHRGLKDQGFAEHQNVAIEYRWAQGYYDRLPARVAELVSRRVAVIFATGGSASGLAAKAATATIPIVFTTGGDPVKEGIVGSLNRPGGNITGVTFFAHALAAKRMELLRELVPSAGMIAVLVNQTNPNAVPDIEEIENAARVLGLQVHVLRASTDAEIDSAFANLSPSRVGALFVNADAFFFSRRSRIVALSARFSLPAIYARNEYVATGGLISYATRVADSFHQAGVYVGRILKGEKPGDLPVPQPTKFELVINLKTAKALGLEIPPKLLALADEVIE